MLRLCVVTLTLMTSLVFPARCEDAPTRPQMIRSIFCKTQALAEEYLDRSIKNSDANADEIIAAMKSSSGPGPVPCFLGDVSTTTPEELLDQMEALASRDVAGFLEVRIIKVVINGRWLGHIYMPQKPHERYMLYLDKQKGRKAEAPARTGASFIS